MIGIVRILAALAALFPVLLPASPGYGKAGLGPHELIFPGPCKVCHDTASGAAQSHGWSGPTYTDQETSRWFKGVSVFCIECHRWAGPAGATPMSGLAYSTGSHGSTPGTLSTPDSWTGEHHIKEDLSGTTLPYTYGWREMQCTSCHNVHVVTNRPFNQRTDIETLCLECHPGRANAGKVGDGNIVTREPAAGEYSSHPTGVVVADLEGNGATSFGTIDRRLTTAVPEKWEDGWVLGGHLADPTSADAAATPFTCQTCHVVHGVSDRPDEHFPGLLAIWEEENPSALCLGCHSTEHSKVAFADGTEVQHPMIGAPGTDFYPEAFSTPDGIPYAWTGEEHFDSGASPFDPLEKGQPFCTSCHDVHGGLPRTSLLFGPNPVDGGKGDWCYSCHPEGNFSGSFRLDPPDLVEARYSEDRNDIELRWLYVAGATGYRIMRSETSGSGYREIASTDRREREHFDSSIESGKTYFFAVQALLETQPGPLSAERPVKTHGLQPPVWSSYSPPARSTKTGDIEPANLNVPLSWMRVTGARAYNIYRSETRGSGYVFLKKSTRRRTSDTTVQVGHTYYYVLTALDRNLNESAHSREVSIEIR